MCLPIPRLLFSKATDGRWPVQVNDLQLRSTHQFRGEKSSMFSCVGWASPIVRAVALIAYPLSFKTIPPTIASISQGLLTCGFALFAMFHRVVDNCIAVENFRCAGRTRRAGSIRPHAVRAANFVEVQSSAARALTGGTGSRVWLGSAPPATRAGLRPPAPLVSRAWAARGPTTWYFLLPQTCWPHRSREELIDSYNRSKLRSCPSLSLTCSLASAASTRP